jgi:hypothetical protein
VRNRVAMAVAKGVRRLVRVSVVLALVPAVLTVAARTASADAGFAASSMPFPVGPVGIGIVVVGLGGLVTGLVRHRRRGVTVLEQNKVLTDRPANEHVA